MSQDIQKREYVIFDVETTGLFPGFGDRIVEIAALKIKDLEPVDRFSSLLDPQREISYGAFQVNQITASMLKGAPQAQEILPRFLDFVGEAALVGHNVQFDLGFLCHELALVERKLKEKTVVLDTLKMARRFIPRLPSYSLWSVAQSLGVKRNQEHRAMADVELTFAVFARLIGMARRQNIQDIRELA
jgi:DNA polymerase-3 subunit alpha (Gram-positive type)